MEGGGFDQDFNFEWKACGVKGVAARGRWLVGGWAAVTVREMRICGILRKIAQESRCSVVYRLEIQVVTVGREKVIVDGIFLTNGSALCVYQALDITPSKHLTLA